MCIGAIPRLHAAVRSLSRLWSGSCSDRCFQHNINIGWFGSCINCGAHTIRPQLLGGSLQSFSSPSWKSEIGTTGASTSELFWYVILWPGLILWLFKSCQEMHCIDLYSTTVTRSSFQHRLFYVAIRRFGSNEACPRRGQRQHSDDTTPAGIPCKDYRCTFDILAPFFLTF